MRRSPNSCLAQDSGKIQRTPKQNCSCFISSTSSTSKATLSSPPSTTAAIRAISLPSLLRDHKALLPPFSSLCSQSPSTRIPPSVSSTRPCSPHQASWQLSVQPGLVVSSRRTRPRSPAMNSNSKVTLVSIHLLPATSSSSHATHPPVFDEDTFQSDALKHILSLLRSFDKYGFTLLTSLCLSSTRSRVKDLWIFSTPEVDSDTILPSSILNPGGGYIPGNTIKLQGSQTSLLRPPGHLRSISEQHGNATLSPSHTRNASVPPPNTTPKSGNTLLKKSPRPGADKLPPVSDNPPLNPPPSSLPFYGTVSKSTPPKPLAPLRTNIPPQILYATPTPASEKAGGPSADLFYSSSPSQPPPLLPRGTLYVANGGPDETDSITAPPPPLLSANAFRDTSIGGCSQGDGEAVRESEFSTMSDNSMDIPLAWTGGLPTTMEEEDPSSGRDSAGQSYALTNRDTPSTPETNPEDRAFSPSPVVPGSWVDHESPNERLQGRPVQQRTSLPPPQPIYLPTKIEPHTTAAYSPQMVGDSTPQSTPQKSRPVTARDSADAGLTRGWVLVNVTASPGFDSRGFDGGRSATDPMPSLPALPTPGVETPHSNGAPTAPPIAPKPKPKPRPPAHNQFSTSGSGGGGGGGSGSEFGVYPTGGQQSAPLGGSVGRSYGARSGNATGRPGGPERPPVQPPAVPASKGTFKRMFTRSNSQRSQKRGQGFDDEKVNIARGVTTLEEPAPVSLVWKKGVNKSVSQLATYSATDLLGPPPILLRSPPPSLPMPSDSEPDLHGMDLFYSPSSSLSPPPSLSSNYLAMSNLSPLQGGGLAAGTGHWVPGSTLATYPAPYHGNASF